MTLTISKNSVGTVIVYTKDERMRKLLPHLNWVLRDVYSDLAGISEWVNNELKEECLFEID